MHISASERGLVRLFSVDLPPEEMTAFRHEDERGSPLLQALGCTSLDMDHVEMFDVADLEELGLTGYMTEGLGIGVDDVREDAARLTNLKGWVLMLRSAAFEGREQRLQPKAPLQWIGTYAEDGAPVHFEPLPDAGAKGAPVVGQTEAAAKPPSPYLTVLLALLLLPVIAVVIGFLVMWIL